MLPFWVFLVGYVVGVYVGWPMDEQLPNVARVDEAYLFTLANVTYKSSAGGSISYLASSLPTWLLFDLLSRTFLGTPSSSDVETFHISLTGVDSADSSNLTEWYLMIVSNSTGLELALSDVMFTTIAKYGQTNGDDGLVVKQGELFSILFSSDVFELELGATRPIIAYYGRSEDRAPLPNWVDFNADNLTFSGTVPYVTSSIAPSVLYGFSFIASDYTGYAGAEGIFKLVVGAHELSTSLNLTIRINGSYDATFDYTVPVLSDVYLDGEVINAVNISLVAPDGLPDYISFNASTYALTGTFPNSSTYDNFTVEVEDVYGNLVSLPYLFVSIDSIFTIDELSDVNATRGEYFEYQILESDFTDFNDTTVNVTFGSDSSWLSYHTSNMTINGDAPDDLDSVDVTVKADSTVDSELRSFNIVGVDAKASSLSSSASSSATSTSSATSSASASTTAAAANNKSSDSNHKKMVLGLAIGIPCFVALVALLLILFFCCCRRRKQEDSELTGDSTEHELTGPGFGVTHDLDDHQETAHQLGALNALKLDNDNLSTMSDETHVGSDTDASHYFDALEKPMKSWRANDASDSNAVKQMLLLQKHASEMSADTVNTEQLFTVRLVDDNLSNRNSSLSFGPLAASNVPLRDASSGNIQRLDSDGNIIDASSTPPASPRPRLKKEPSASLNNIVEEDSNNTFYNTTNESSNYNLMARFLNLDNISVHSDPHSDESLGDVFKPITADNGEVKWRRSEDNGVLRPLPSPHADSFLLDREATPKNNANIATGNFYDLNNSRTSVYSDFSASNLVNEGGRKGSKAKLVDFTRKASLRESSRQQDVEHSGETAQIHNEDSD